MLDQKRAFDEIVDALREGPGGAQRILDNRIYQQISATLAGSHEYAAMAKLYEHRTRAAATTSSSSTRRRPRTRSTSSTRRSSWPRRSTRRRSSGSRKPYLAAGRFSLKAVGMGAAFVLKRLAQLRRLASSSTTWRSSSSSSTSVLGGFQRARARGLRAPAPARGRRSCWSLSPEPLSVDEAHLLPRAAGSSRSMPLGALRGQPRAPARRRRAGARGAGRAADGAARAARLFARRPGAGGRSDFDRTYREFERARRRSMRARSSGSRRATRARRPVVTVPFFDQDISTSAACRQMVRFLAG